MVMVAVQPRPVLVRKDRATGDWVVTAPANTGAQYQNWYDAIDYASFEADRIRRQLAWVLSAEAYRSQHRACR
jgi:hypothetical protein